MPLRLELGPKDLRERIVKRYNKEAVVVSWADIEVIPRILRKYMRICLPGLRLYLKAGLLRQRPGKNLLLP